MLIIWQGWAFKEYSVEFTKPWLSPTVMVGGKFKLIWQAILLVINIACHIHSLLMIQNYNYYSARSWQKKFSLLADPRSYCRQLSATIPPIAQPCLSMSELRPLDHLDTKRLWQYCGQMHLPEFLLKSNGIVLATVWRLGHWIVGSKRTYKISIHLRKILDTVDWLESESQVLIT